MKAPSHPALELAPSQSFEAIDEIDALTEIVNIGVGRAAAALSELVEAHVELRVPQLKLQAINDLQAIEGAVNERLSTLVTQDFVGPINGRAGLLFSEESENH